MTCQATILADEGAAALQLNEEQCLLSVVESFHVYVRAGQGCHWALPDLCKLMLVACLGYHQVI